MKRILFALAFAVVALSTPVAVHAQITGTETVTLADPSCTTAATCTAQIYRATGTCPPSGLGTLTWTELASNFAATTVTASNSTFVYPDTTAVSNSSYCYYATVTFIAGGSACRPSSFFTMTTPALVPALAPSISGSYGPTATPASTPAAARVNVTPSPAAAPSISGSYKPTAAPATTKK